VTDIPGLWIVLGFMAWILVGFVGLAYFWMVHSRLGLYFSEMEAVPRDQRASHGWEVENPITPVFGVRRDYANRRLIWRLALWGAPPRLEHSVKARQTLRQYRILWWTALAVQFLILLAASVLLTLAFLWLVVFGVGVLLFVIRPSNWPEKLS